MTSEWNILFWEYEFFRPLWLTGILLAVLLSIYLYKREHKKKGSIKFSRFSKEQMELASKKIYRLDKIRFTLFPVILTLFFLALAGPVHKYNPPPSSIDYKNGIDIMLVMDVSLSMLAKDFDPNRLVAAKKVAVDFIKGRPNDRIGLVVYAGEAYTSCPVTLDHELVIRSIQSADGENIEGGTAIGTGLGTAVAHLQNDSTPSKVVILLTDGSNNSGVLSPLDAAELAKTKKVRVYTIGVGSMGIAESPTVTPFGIRFQKIPVEIDEEVLKTIAKTTGGKYFRATDEQKLKEIYREIEKMEKRKIAGEQHPGFLTTTPEAFLNWALILLLLLAGIQFFYLKKNE